MVLLFFEEPPLFSIVAVPIYIPNNSAEGSLFFTSLPTLVIWLFFFFFFNDSHSDRYEAISRCGFNLHFADD